MQKMSSGVCASIVLALTTIGAGAFAQTIAGGAPHVAAAPAPPRPITGPAALSTAPSASTLPPAVAMGNADSKTAAAPVAGANSFTESEARSRLEAHGYANVSALQKDAQSIWRGTATKDGRPVRVALDYQGNIVAQ
jgi:hypothetical protein